MTEEKWEIELATLIEKVIVNSLTPYTIKERDLALIKVKNFIQKEKIIAKIRENQQWISYFKSSDINKPELAKHFEGMNMKYSGVLSRFKV